MTRLKAYNARKFGVVVNLHSTDLAKKAFRGERWWHRFWVFTRVFALAGSVILPGNGSLRLKRLAERLKGVGGE